MQKKLIKSVPNESFHESSRRQFHEERGRPRCQESGFSAVCHEQDLSKRLVLLIKLFPQIIWGSDLLLPTWERVSQSSLRK